MTNIAEKISPGDKLIAELELNQDSLTGSDVIRSTRRNALKSFSKQGLPARKSEEYKYSPVNRLFQKELSFVTASPVSDEKENSFALAGLDASVIRILNGVVHIPVSGFDSATCAAWSLKSLPKEELSFFENHFAHYALPDTDPFIALNTAAFQDVLIIKIADGAALAKPILIQNITDSTHASFTQPRIFIHVGKNASVEIIEQFASTKKEYATVCNAVSEIVVESGAKALFYKLQNDCAGLQLISTTQVYQHHDSHFDTHTVTFSGSWTRNNLNIVPDGEHCETHLNGLFILNEEQHTDNHTLVDHRKPNCESNQLYRGILKNKSTGVFNGKIYVRPDAQKTNAYQSSKNMLLSDDASMYTKPQLEIYADDVKCSHGSSTGQIDEEALFYLRARGISADSARILLMQAFAKDVVNTIRIEPLRKEIELLIEKRLAN